MQRNHSSKGQSVQSEKVPGYFVMQVRLMGCLVRIVKFV